MTGTTAAPATGAVAWLRQSTEPAVRYRTLTELGGRPAEDAEVTAARAQIRDGRAVQALLDGLREDGTFGVRPYRKWTGGHWRLVSLADLRCPPGDERLHPVVDAELAWATRLRPRWVADRARRCTSQEGNALGACCRLGYADDPRIAALVQRLLDCQWPDGGWNCDPRPAATHSSFHESITPLWGLSEYRLATGDRRVDAAIDRAGEMFLRAGLFRSARAREERWPHFLRLRYPTYWHYDILLGLRVLTDVGRVTDPRAAEALERLVARRRPDGRWAVDGAWWRPADARASAEVVDWGRTGPNEMLTFHALRVLEAAGWADG